LTLVEKKNEIEERVEEEHFSFFFYGSLSIDKITRYSAIAFFLMLMALNKN